MRALKEDGKNFAVLVLKVLPFLLALLWIGPVRSETAQPLTIAGVSREEALRLGEKMYREGILPSGEPLEGVAGGDIPVNGRMFSCVSCHLRSGMGSFEGNVISLPIDGPRLYKPLPKMGDLSKSAREKFPKWYRDDGDYRPAYTDETLAIALRAGEDPSGREFNGVMPRYFLNDQDMEILTYYLKNLSIEMSPGVSDTTMRLATVVTEEVSKEDREAMLAPLQFYTNTWGRSRHLERRAKAGPFTEEDMNRGYRKLVLAVWELKGPPQGWRKQMEEYYQKDPVFALVGGITTGDWGPIHEFSEEHRIPCFFPITDFPVISERDWYTLYFSRGLYQEGEAAAKYLHGMADISKDVSIVQLFRNNRAGLALSKAFRETWQNLSQRPPEDLMLESKEVVNEDFWKQLIGRHKHSVIISWLDPKDLLTIGGIADVPNRPEKVFVSSSLMGQSLYSLPEKVRGFVYITYPYRLPQEERKFKSGVEAWLKSNKIPITNLNIESKMYDLIMVISSPLTMLRDYFYRDRLLEFIDMMEDQRNKVALYPSLSFGPRQRYASKGCYIVQLTEGPQPELVRRSDWVIY
jgi:hypothetical protein